jgi:hypothetical protein
MKVAFTTFVILYAADLAVYNGKYFGVLTALVRQIGRAFGLI